MFHLPNILFIYGCRSFFLNLTQIINIDSNFLLDQVKLAELKSFRLKCEGLHTKVLNLLKALDVVCIQVKVVLCQNTKTKTIFGLNW